MDMAQEWGLPPGFAPVRYIISDDAKNALRGQLPVGEPVIVSISNEGDTITIVATPSRLFTVKTGSLGAGALGASVREYPWEGVFNFVMTPMTHNLKIAVHYRSSDGRKIEVGRRAMMAKPAVENLMPFEIEAGTQVFRALLQVWNFKKAAAEQESGG
jgi:hypothetical protein